MVLQQIRQRGGTVVKDIWEESDKKGTARMAVVQTYGDTTHTLLDLSNYKGDFLPGFHPVKYSDPLCKLL